MKFCLLGCLLLGCFGRSLHLEGDTICFTADSNGILSLDSKGNKTRGFLVPRPNGTFATWPTTYSTCVEFSIDREGTPHWLYTAKGWHMIGDLRPEIKCNRTQQYHKQCFLFLDRAGIPLYQRFLRYYHTMKEPVSVLVLGVAVHFIGVSTGVDFRALATLLGQFIDSLFRAVFKRLVDYGVFIVREMICKYLWIQLMHAVGSWFAER
jgi:hypothetical protein